MRHALTAARRTPRQNAWQSDAIEWEELPSMADSLHQRLVVLGQRHHGAAQDSGFDWERTQVSDFDALPPQSEPFREALEGLAMREVVEPDVFRHFFGAEQAA